ncbi:MULTISPECIES: DUF1254 domain-containing protein [Bordetella]|uniref:Cell envelope protein n=1 Tax=Bordetella genomosp. 6 TaxID=463024 RepID=A0ABX4FA55_9BORD|nr:MULTISPECIES: DUF1254 domain-containing protein [Bordetella]KCV60774.1 PF06863 family protein [Bordetella bronchiseptica 99-R-0433]OZI73447.1 hypothetical protein CAL23_20025 [Bordetella genomosp. 6]VTQ93606.1 Uncharacterized conserved protein [Bordetella bronchiseptica]
MGKATWRRMWERAWALAGAAALAVLAGCAAPGAQDPGQARNTAREAYIYAYPMLYHYRSMYEQAIDTASPAYLGGFGVFQHRAEPYTPQSVDVATPNVDTLYSRAWLDLRAEPWVLSLPAVPKSRYNAFQLVDMYTYNLAYLGTRATGFGSGHYLIAGPGWTGPVPKGITQVVRADTDFVAVLGRTALNGPADVKAVHALQARYGLRPLSAYTGTAAPAGAPVVDWLPWNEQRASSIGFIAYLNQLLAHTQPQPESEADMMARFARIGVEPGRAFDPAGLDAATRRAVDAGIVDAQQAIEQGARHAAAPATPASLYGSREQLGGDYLKRAVAAAVGIYGNTADEAIYLTIGEDAQGRPLDGARAYELRFASGRQPPVRFFWSISVYALPARGLVDNPIDRYAIGSRTKGIKRGRDGSLTLYLQHDAPPRAHAPNWLPTPAGPFVVVARFYGPQPALRDGAWVMPALVPAR